MKRQEKHDSRLDPLTLDNQELKTKDVGTEEPSEEQLIDLQLISELRSGLEQLEQLDSAAEPDLSFFLQQVQETKVNSRKKLAKELAIFWGLALAILALWTATYFHSPTIFLTLQGITTVTLPIIVYFVMKKEVKKSL